MTHVFEYCLLALLPGPTLSRCIVADLDSATSPPPLVWFLLLKGIPDASLNAQDDTQDETS